jgi:hypothetical protein
MSLAITDQASTIKFVWTNGDEEILDKSNMSFRIRGRWVYVSENHDFVNINRVLKIRYSEVTSPVVASNQELVTELLLYKAQQTETIGAVVVTDGTTNLKIEDNGSLPVTLQDQTTPTVITHMSVLQETTTTTAPVAINDTVVSVANATGIVAGKFLAFFDPASVRFMNAFVISVNVLDVTIDRPFDFAFPSGSYVDVSEHDLTKVGVGTSMDVTRVMFHCVADSACNLTTFGNIIGGITNGLVLRKRDGEVFNIFNVKNNGELKEIMFDFDIMATGTVGQGEDGFFGRLTFAGQNKMGVTVRLAINEDLELFIQDDITSLLHFSITVEGSIVKP